MTDTGPRTPDLAADDTWVSQIQSDALLISRAFAVLDQMSRVEGFAYTEDTYSARIPGKMLQSWHETLSRVLFRLRSEIE